MVIEYCNGGLMGFHCNLIARDLMEFNVFLNGI